MCPGKISAGISTKHQGRNILKNQVHHMLVHFFFAPMTDLDFKDALMDTAPRLINEDERGFF
jgi:hypothetical protein